MAKIVCSIASAVALVAGVDVQGCATGTRYMSDFAHLAGDAASCSACEDICCSHKDAVKYTWFDEHDSLSGQCYCITGSATTQNLATAHSGECGWRSNLTSSSPLAQILDAEVTHPPVTHPPALEADLDAEVTCVSDSNCLHPSKHETCCSGKSHYVTIFACGENKRCGCLDHGVGCSYNSDCCSGSCLSGHCENPPADVDANVTRQPALDAEVTHPPVAHPPALEADLNAEVTCVSDSNCLHPSKHETCCSGKSHYVTIFACGENRRCGCLDHAVGCSYNSDCCSGSCLSGHCENPGAVANASVVLV